MLTHQPISQETIESMINRHTKPNFKIGDLYNFLIPSSRWGVQATWLLSPLLDCSMNFDYEGYLSVCKFGKTLPKNRHTYSPSAYDVVKPYTLCFSYSYLVDNNIVKKEIKSEFHDPIYHNQTMHSKISIFCYECIKVIKKYEDE